jgi:hypothetical protein
MTDVPIPWLDSYIEIGVLDQLKAKIAEAATLGGQAMAVGPTAIVDQAIDDTVQSALHLDLLALLAEGWTGASEIRAYRSTKAPPAGKAAVVRLGKHSVHRDVRPTIVVHFGVARRFPVDISVSVTGTFEGIELSIADGAITAVGTGTCQLSLQPKAGGANLGKPIVVHDWKLPGRYTFARPIAIP